MSGHYRTEKGSTAEVFGHHSGSYRIEFDWFEEGACIEACPSVDTTGGETWLHWNCDCCGSGQAMLKLDQSLDQAVLRNPLKSP
jgi:hypothetical protein